MSAKSALKGQLALWLTALVAIGGAAMLTGDPERLSAVRLMVDMRLFTHRIILSGGDDGDDRPDYPGGF